MTNLRVSHNFNKIKFEYLTTKKTLADLSTEYNIPSSHLQKEAQENNWDILKDIYHIKLNKATLPILYELIISSSEIEAQSLLGLKKISALISKYLTFLEDADEESLDDRLPKNLALLTKTIQDIVILSKKIHGDDFNQQVKENLTKFTEAVEKIEKDQNLITELAFEYNRIQKKKEADKTERDKKIESDYLEYLELHNFKIKPSSYDILPSSKNNSTQS